jgi:hypothetical protein
VAQERTSSKLSPNVRETDWDKLNVFLGNELAVIPTPSEIQTDEDLGRKIEQLTLLIQKAISSEVPENNPCPLSKRWWTKDLSKMKKVINGIHGKSFKN